jgi:hypothetical protein
MTNRVVIPARQAAEAGEIDFFVIDSRAPYTFTNSGSGLFLIT